MPVWIKESAPQYRHASDHQLKCGVCTTPSTRGDLLEVSNNAFLVCIFSSQHACEYEQHMNPGILKRKSVSVLDVDSERDNYRAEYSQMAWLRGIG
jgi:hypothetical protein